jgi:hypothetical protein
MFTSVVTKQMNVLMAYLKQCAIWAIILTTAVFASSIIFLWLLIYFAVVGTLISFTQYCIISGSSLVTAVGVVAVGNLYLKRCQRQRVEIEICEEVKEFEAGKVEPQETTIQQTCDERALQQDWNTLPTNEEPIKIVDLVLPGLAPTGPAPIAAGTIHVAGLLSDYIQEEKVAPAPVVEMKGISLGECIVEDYFTPINKDTAAELDNITAGFEYM